MEIENARNDDDIAIYIDELKCDDPNLKLNAVTKIVDIARILGSFPSDFKDLCVPEKNLCHI